MPSASVTTSAKLGGGGTRLELHRIAGRRDARSDVAERGDAVRDGGQPVVAADLGHHAMRDAGAGVAQLERVVHGLAGLGPAVAVARGFGLAVAVRVELARVHRDLQGLVVAAAARLADRENEGNLALVGQGPTES